MASPFNKGSTWENWKDWVRLQDWIGWTPSNPTVDGSEIRRGKDLGCKKLVNYGIAYQPQLVIAGFLNHPQYCEDWIFWPSILLWIWEGSHFLGVIMCVYIARKSKSTKLCPRLVGILDPRIILKACKNHELPRKSYLAVGLEESDVYGAVTDSAKMELWRVTRLPWNQQVAPDKLMVGRRNPNFLLGHRHLFRCFFCQFWKATYYAPKSNMAMENHHCS